MKTLSSKPPASTSLNQKFALLTDATARLAAWRQGCEARRGGVPASEAARLTPRQKAKHGANLVRMKLGAQCSDS